MRTVMRAVRVRHTGLRMMGRYALLVLLSGLAMGPPRTLSSASAPLFSATKCTVDVSKQLNRANAGRGVRNVRSCLLCTLVALPPPHPPWQ